MKFYPCLYLLLLVTFCSAQGTEAVTTFKVAAADTFFGTPVPDPYRWLEDANSKTTRDWLQKQEYYAFDVKKKFKDENAVLWKTYEDAAEDHTYLIKSGAYYFGFTQDSKHGRVLFSRETLDEKLWDLSLRDIDHVVFYANNTWGREYIEDFALSDDTKYLAVAISGAGSSWLTINVKNLKTSTVLSDKIEWIKNSRIVWWKDGFFYRRFANPPKDSVEIAPNTSQQLCYHKVGDDQANDIMVYALPESVNGFFQVDISSNKQYLVLNAATKASGKLYHTLLYKDLNDGLFADFKPVLSVPLKDDVRWKFIDFIENKFVILTDLNASHGKVVTVQKDSANHINELIPPFKNVITDVRHLAGRLVVLYYSEGAFSACSYNYHGDAMHCFQFDKGMNISGFYGTPTDSVILVFQNSFYCPTTNLKIDFRNDKLKTFENTTVHFDPRKYETKVVNYKSDDGTTVPMYLTYKKGLVQNGKSPVILFGYGSFGNTEWPFYRFSNIMFFENGGILAVPLLRGGGALGSDWHRQGQKLNKQTTIDDFVAAANFLVDSNYTNKNLLSAEGWEAGGVVVAAAVNQHPELFRAVVLNDALLDLVRSPAFTLGRYNENEYGSLHNNEDFESIMKYTPLQNIVSGVRYPATLAITDALSHHELLSNSFKYIATLQEKSTGVAPHVLYHESDDDYTYQDSRMRKHESDYRLNFLFTQFGLRLKGDF